MNLSKFKYILPILRLRLASMVIFSSAIGTLLAWEEFNLLRFVSFIFFTSLLVAGTCMMNAYIEREIDARMERTKARVAAFTYFKEESILSFSLLLIILSTLGLYLTTNPLTTVFAILASLIYLYAYTPLKRKTRYFVYIGAIPGALPPLMGYTAMTNHLNINALHLFLFLFIWQIPHFLAISICHFKDYTTVGIKIFPQKIGISATKRMIILTTFIMLLVATLIPYWFELTSLVSLVIMTLGGLALLYISLEGLAIGSNFEDNQKWARRFYLGTVYYLPSIFLGLLIK